ncbi:MAG: YdeI/OmpD-associated family protein [Bacteroidota bacterium]
MDPLFTLYITDRTAWRQWLSQNFQSAPEIWLIYPKKATGKPRIPYNDAVEEALCFGWIDSIVKAYDQDHTLQRFTPRKAKSSFSQANKERLKWLAAQQMIHPSILPKVEPVIREEFIFPGDILQAIQATPNAWTHYQQFSESYKRIRIAYIDSARKRPEEFQKRLHNFIEKTRQGKWIKGFGGIDKYY